MTRSTRIDILCTLARKGGRLPSAPSPLASGALRSPSFGRVSTIAEAIDVGHRYLVKRNSDGAYVGSTDDLGVVLPDGHCMVDTIGVDGLGTVDGRKGIPAFLGMNPLARALRDWRGLSIVGLTLALTIFAYGAMA